MAELDRDVERWRRIETLFDGALDQPAPKRAEWVRTAAGDDGVADEVLGLLAAHDREGVLDGAAAVLAFGPDGVPLEERFRQALGHRYRLERTLGQGGMATVFLAYELKHERPVVVKVLRPEVAAWLGARRFLSEIQIVAQLSHPNILALLDSGEAEGLLFYVMPYLAGDTLRARIASGPLPLDVVGTLLRDVAEALAHAHRHGIVHRDLKPENVLCAGGHAYLMDFGVAKLRPEPGGSGQTTEGLPIGTPAYMAPEQAAGERIDQRVDVYAWGLLARELLLGRLTRRGDITADRPDAPRGLVALIDAAVSEAPGDRPADAQAVLERLDATAPSAVTAARQRRWRWLWFAILMGLALAAFIATRGGP